MFKTNLCNRPSFKKLRRCIYKEVKMTAIDLDTDYNFVVWDGGTYKGKELCMECLPIEHRWGYSS